MDPWAAPKRIQKLSQNYNFAGEAQSEVPGSFWISLCVILVAVWHPFGSILVAIWDPFGSILTLSWSSYGNFYGQFHMQFWHVCIIVLTILPKRSRRVPVVSPPPQWNRMTRFFVMLDSICCPILALLLMLPVLFSTFVRHRIRHRFLDVWYDLL